MGQLKHEHHEEICAASEQDDEGAYEAALLRYAFAAGHLARGLEDYNRDVEAFLAEQESCNGQNI